MSLIASLRRLGGTLGIIHVAPAAAPGASAEPPRPPKLIMRVVSLSELTAASPPAAGAVLARSAAEIASELTAATPWSAPRVAAALREAPLAGLSGDELRQRLAAQLAAAGTTAEAVVGDALARDQALDAAAAELRATLAAARAQRASRRQALTAQLAALAAERDALDQADAADATAWAAWWQGKRAVEAELAGAIAPLIDRPVVSVDEGVPGLDGKG